MVVGDDAQAVVLLAIGFGVKRERQPGMERLPFLIRIAPDLDVDVVRQLQVLREVAERRQEQVAELVFGLLREQLSDGRSPLVPIEFLIQARRRLVDDVLRRDRIPTLDECRELADAIDLDASESVLLARLQELARREANRGIESGCRE